MVWRYLDHKNRDVPSIHFGREVRHRKTQLPGKRLWRTHPVYFFTWRILHWSMVGCTSACCVPCHRSHTMTVDVQPGQHGGTWGGKGWMGEEGREHKAAKLTNVIAHGHAPGGQGKTNREALHQGWEGVGRLAGHRRGRAWTGPLGRARPRPQIYFLIHTSTLRHSILHMKACWNMAQHSQHQKTMTQLFAGSGSCGICAMILSLVYHSSSLRVVN